MMSSQQDSHNCNFNIDRIRKGPVDWTQIEGSSKIFTDHSFPADQTMLSWKEYPRTIGGLSKYLSWFKDFRRPKDLVNLNKSGDSPSTLSLFGTNFETSNFLMTNNFEQGTVGDNYFLTMLAALSEKKNFIPSLFH